MDLNSGNSGNNAALTGRAFASNYMPNPTNEFLDSNSLVAKVAFLLFVLLAFVLLFRVGMSVLSWLIHPSNSPHLIDGMVDAKQLMVIPQDPDSQGAITIYRSVNEDKGIEFTWSVWIFIDDLTYNTGKYRCVFYKGNDFAANPDAEIQGMNFPNNAPGLYLAPHSNKLIVIMNTFNVINEQVTIDDVPLNKWVNVMIRCQDTVLDVYVNGTIVKSHHLHGVAKQNYGDVYVATNGGFSGYISNLWYFDHALSISEINRVMDKGPNTNMKGDNGINSKNGDYLSLRWYFMGSGVRDGYNM